MTGFGVFNNNTSKRILNELMSPSPKLISSLATPLDRLQAIYTLTEQLRTGKYARICHCGPATVNDQCKYRAVLLLVNIKQRYVM